MAQLLPPGMMLSLCLEAALVGTSLAVSFSMRFLFPSTFPGFRNCFPRVGLILCVLGSFGLLSELAGGELQRLLVFCSSPVLAKVVILYG